MSTIVDDVKSKTIYITQTYQQTKTDFAMGDGTKQAAHRSPENAGRLAHMG